MSFTQQNPTSQLESYPVAIQQHGQNKPTSLEKIQEKKHAQNKLLSHLIDTFQFEPGGYCEGLYVSRRSGAVLYRSGGVLEIDFGFDEPESNYNAVLDKVGVVKNTFAWLQQLISRLQR